MLKYDVFETSLGWVGAVSSSRGLRRLTLPEPSREAAEDAIFPAQTEGASDPDEFEGLRQRLEGYFRGEDVDLSEEPVDLDGAPPFFRAAWDACRQIPPGETRSYSWLAAEAGQPEARRAAGQAMARNRLPLVIPCHRVLRADGSAGGFGGSVGISLKKRLLGIEASARKAGDGG